MIVFPNAKINIGLNITEKRSDGFHNIETIFYPIALCDCLEFVENHTNADTFQLSGIPIATNQKPNLVLQALEKVRLKYKIPALDIHLVKKIPSQAGLGGGSSDAAFMITALDTYFDLKMTVAQKISIAAQLGSDCAFFIQNTPMLATGRGDIFTPIQMQEHLIVVVVKPDISIPTPLAYSKVTPQQPKYNLQQSATMPISEWKQQIKNDFEQFLFPEYPILATIKQDLYNSGAIYASMTGSGSAMFAIFKQPPLLPPQLTEMRIL